MMIEAAKLAANLSSLINWLLTIRTAGMLRMNEGGILLNGTQPECIRDFLDKILHFIRYRYIPVAFIWVRKYCNYNQEYLHIEVSAA